MTKREKVLLCILLVIVVLFLPHFFVTRKMFAEYNVLRKEFNVLDAKRETYYETKDAIKAKEINALEMETQIAMLQAGIADISKSYNAHYVFMDLAKKNNVKVISLKISEIVDAPEIPLPEIPVVAEDAKNAETVTDAIESIDPAAVIEVPQPTIKPCKLVMDISVTGSRDNIITLVDDINKYSNNFIVSGFDATVLEEGDPIEANISTGVYMVLTEEQRGNLN